MAASHPGNINLRRHAIVEPQSLGAQLPPPFVLQASSQSTSPSASHCPFRAVMTIFFSPSSSTAFFKLQSNVSLLVPSRGRDAFDTLQSNVYLIIRPEQIQSLVYSRVQLPARLDPLYRNLSGQETIRLSFTLSHTATWVVPNLDSLLPKMPVDASTLHAYQFLAGQRAVDVYIPANTLSDSQVSSLCDAVSRPEGSTRLETSREHDRLQDWYRGFEPGGKVVAIEHLDHIISPDTPTASPPSYDELDPSPPSVPPAPSRKRSRVASGLDASRDKRPSQADQMEVEANMTAAVARGGAVAERLASLILEAEKKEALLQERICAADTKLKQLQQLEVADQEDKEIKRQADKEALKEYIDERLEDLRTDLCEFVGDRYDDFCIEHVLRTEMEEFVDTAVSSVQEDLQERLETGVRVRFLDS